MNNSSISSECSAKSILMHENLKNLIELNCVGGEMNR